MKKDFSNPPKWYEQYYINKGILLDGNLRKLANYSFILLFTFTKTLWSHQQNKVLKITLLNFYSLVINFIKEKKNLFKKPLTNKLIILKKRKEIHQLLKFFYLGLIWNYKENITLVIYIYTHTFIFNHCFPFINYNGMGLNLT